MSEDPKIQEQEEFKKLQAEYEIESGRRTSMGWKMKKIMSLGVTLARYIVSSRETPRRQREQDRKCFEVECPNPDGKSAIM